MVKTPCFQRGGAWVQSLVGELRSHMLIGQKKKANSMYYLIKPEMREKEESGTTPRLSTSFNPKDTPQSTITLLLQVKK